MRGTITGFIGFTDIMETYINGNLTTAVKAIDKFGWDNFAQELEDCPNELMNAEKKLEMILRLIRINAR